MYIFSVHSSWKCRDFDHFREFDLDLGWRLELSDIQGSFETEAQKWVQHVCNNLAQ